MGKLSAELTATPVDIKTTPWNRTQVTFTLVNTSGRITLENLEGGARVQFTVLSSR